MTTVTLIERTMSRIRVDDLHKDWMKDSKYQREYEALEEEFSLIASLIEARPRAGLTQEQVAQRMKTTQAVITQLEGGAPSPPLAKPVDTTTAPDPS